jgi:hypothetical protein
LLCSFREAAARTFQTQLHHPLQVSPASITVASKTPSKAHLESLSVLDSGVKIGTAISLESNQSEGEKGIVTSDAIPARKQVQRFVLISDLSVLCCLFCP